MQLAFVTSTAASFGPGPASGCVRVVLLFAEPEVGSHFWFQLFPPLLNVFFGISLIQAFVVGKMKLFFTFKCITLGKVHLLFIDFRKAIAYIDCILWHNKTLIWNLTPL